MNRTMQYGKPQHGDTIVATTTAEHLLDANVDDDDIGFDVRVSVGWDPDSSAESERARLGEIYAEAETCSSLWIAVIEQAVHDLTWLRRIRNKARLARHERSRLRRVQESDPVEFFRSGAFRGVCDLLGIPADVVRAHYRVDELIEDVRAA